jgi:hypothetical protein
LGGMFSAELCSRRQPVSSALNITHSSFTRRHRHRHRQRLGMGMGWARAQLGGQPIAPQEHRQVSNHGPDLRGSPLCSALNIGLAWTMRVDV